MNPLSISSFRDELEKIAWFGTFYHGSSPANEESISREGLKASKGGTSVGATGALEKALGVPPIDKYRKNSKGAVHMERSRTNAKMYGMLHRLPDVMRGAKEEIQKSPPVPEGASKLTKIRKGLGRVARGAKHVAKEYLNYNPIAVQGKGLKTKIDWDSGTGVKHFGDIPVSRVSRSKPGILNRVARRLLK